jgi:hypothetical protein
MKKNLIYYLLTFYALICTLTIIFFNGTGDVEDSIAHYLFAKSALLHPELYFDHWAKPVFVLLASPFAQFGFTGMKIFNALVTLFTIFITYKIAEKLKIKNVWLVVVVMMFSPLYYVLTFSGLTEPLFALFVSAGVLLCVRQKYLAAAIVISFLPYVRSEGLIIEGVFTLYLINKRIWAFIPWLLTGSIVYGIAGYFVHGTFFWVFTEIPYAKLTSVYGSGSPFHFVEDLINVVGIPLYILFWIGFLSLIIAFITKKTTLEENILILLGFTCFFIAHSLFWYLGIFNSMGLKRVFLGVIPLMAIIIVNGFNFVTEELLSDKLIAKKILQGVIILYIIAFPFMPNPSSINWKKDMTLCNEQQLANKIVHFIKNKNIITYPLYYNHHYFSVALNVDHFDKSRKQNLTFECLNQMKPGSIIIWDNRYALKESGITIEELDTDSDFEKLFSCTGPERFGEITYVVYRKKE